MRRYLVMALAALALAIAAPSAFATRIIFDPPAPPPSGIPPIVGGTDCTIGVQPPGSNDYTPCSIGQLNTTYSVEFVGCSFLSHSGVTPPAGSTYCLWMNNVTGHGATTFTFSFDVPSGVPSGDTLQCSSQGRYVATSNCPSVLPATPGLFTVSFFAQPPVPDQTDFYIFTDFANSPGYANVTVSVPEPGVLGMFGLGLLALGVAFGWQKRRQAQTSRI